MQGTGEGLRFVVRFAGMDLEQLRADDWLDLRNDLQAFLSGQLSGVTFSAVVSRESSEYSPFPEEYSKEDFQALQQELRRILTSVLWLRDSGGTGRPGTLVMGVQVVVQLIIKEGIAPGYNPVMVQGSTRDIFFWTVSHLLAQEGAHHLARCPACHTIFYRNRNQVYCSRRCVNRVNQRTWRAAQQHAAQTALVDALS